MAEPRQSIHGMWTTRWGYILAATGSAVGLGNVWKFPYIAGENGGGAFVLVYLVCIVLIGIPVMMGEVLIGRRGRRSPAGSMGALAQEAETVKAWSLVGWMGVTAAFFILSFYVVIAGWAVEYIFTTALGTFKGSTAGDVGQAFEAMTSSPVRLIAWTTVMVLATMFVVGSGVEKGIERSVRLLMPLMLVILLIMIGYAMAEGAFAQGLEFLFKPDFAELSANGVLIALGHAFFTLSLASGVMMTYGSYLPSDTSIGSTSVMVASADTVIALMAGMAIFPIVFAHGLEPGAGPGLIFVTLPIAFGNMPFGVFFGTLFFIMLTFAAFTSAISLIEPFVAWLVEQIGLTRATAASLAGLALWTMSLGSVFSFNLIADVHFLGELNFFDSLDYVTANIMLPLGGLSVAIFTAWIMKEAATRDELSIPERFYRTWRFCMRFIAPILIVIVFLNAIGIVSLTPTTPETPDQQEQVIMLDEPIETTSPPSPLPEE